MWNLRYRGDHSASSNGEPIYIATELSSKVITAYIQVPYEKTWHRAGYLTQVLQVPEIGTVFGGESIKLEFLPQVVQFPTNKGIPYTLQLSPVPWLRNFVFSVWELIEELDMPIYPLASTSQKSNSFVDTTPSIRNVGNVAGPTLILPANPERTKFKLTNTANKAVWFDFVNTVGAALPATKVSANFEYADDFGWTGEVWAVIEGGTSQSIRVREFT